MYFGWQVVVHKSSTSYKHLEYNNTEHKLAVIQVHTKDKT